MIGKEEKKKKKRTPEKVLNAQKFITAINEGTYKVKPSDEAKIADAKLILAVYGCQQEGVPVTVPNLIIVLGPDAPHTLKYLKPSLYPQYGIIDAKI